MVENAFCVALEVGGPGDSSAVAVLEAFGPPDWDFCSPCPPESLKLQVRGLHRFPPGTPYKDMGEFVRKIQALPEVFHADHTYFIMDQTAVGDEVIRLIERHAGKAARSVVIEGRHSVEYSDGLYHIPKKILVGGISLGLQSDTLEISEALGETHRLAEELINYQNRPTSAASLNPDTWREEQSDDLVLATGIASWNLRNPPIWKVYW